MAFTPVPRMSWRGTPWRVAALAFGTLSLLCMIAKLFIYSSWLSWGVGTLAIPIIVCAVMSFRRHEWSAPPSADDDHAQEPGP